MVFKDLLQQDESQWPDKEYEKEFEKQKNCFPPQFWDRYYGDCTYPYLHGWILEEMAYSNPTNQTSIHPSFVIRLVSDNESCTLVFPHIHEITMSTMEPLVHYAGFVEEILKAFVWMNEGCVEFVCQFASGLKLYIRSSGMDSTFESNEAD